MQAHYQPIVSLADRSVVGFEALARDETGAFPAARFAAARAAGDLAELDTACQRAALAGAARLQRPATLFINVEPECFDGPPRLDAEPPFKVILEITERGLTSRPAEMLLAVERTRRRGWGVAVDDLGADWRSMALLPFLRPDVVKLDRGVLADPSSHETARVMRGARGYIERHGGLLLAEGIEDAEHERRALAFGARFGQGWRYGRPAPLDGTQASPRQPGIRLVHPRTPVGSDTPFQLLRQAGIAPMTATKAELLALSVDLEQEATDARDPAVVLATFQNADKFTPRVAERYERLARGAAFVVAFGHGLSPEPAPGVRGAHLVEGERLRDEWTVAVVTATSARALIARDLGDVGPDLQRRFDYVLTEDPDLVLRAGRALMLRIASDAPARPAFRADVTPPPAAPARPARRPGAPWSPAS